MDSFSLPALVSRLSTLDSAGAWQLAGWTMLHFLWIGAAVAVAAAVLRAAVRRMRSQVRYLAALSMLGLFAAAPAVTAAWLLQVRGDEFVSAVPRGRESFFAADAGLERPEVLLRRKKAPDPLPTADEPATELPTQTLAIAPAAQTVTAESRASNSAFDSPRDSLGAALEITAGVLPYVWIVGAPCMFLLLGTGLVAGERLRRRSLPVVEGPLADALAQLRQTFGGRTVRRLAVSVCDRVASPVLVGIVRPLVLFPPAAVTGLSPAEIEMILLHELAHVRRWDNLVNLVQRLVESLLFFHPAVWWLSGWVRQEREHCCDAFVIRELSRRGRKSPRRSYARLLLDLAAAHRPRAATAAGTAFAARNLKTRVRHILSMEEQPMRISLKTLLAMLVLAIVTVALTTTAARGLVTYHSEPDAPQAAANDGQPIEDALPPDPIDLAAPPSTEPETDSPETADRPADARPSLDDLREQYERALAELRTKPAEFFALAKELGGSFDPNQNIEIKMALVRWTVNRAERRGVQQRLARAYTQFQQALKQRDSHTIERMVEDAIRSDPSLQQLQSQMLWLDTRITQSKITSGNRRSRGVARLEEQKQRLTEEILRKQYEAQAELYRSRIEKLDKEAERITEELKRLTDQNKALVERMDELKELADHVDELGREILRLESANSAEAYADEEETDEAASSDHDSVDPSSTLDDGDTSSPEASDPAGTLQSQEDLRVQYDRALGELNTRRQEYVALAKQFGSSSHPMAISRSQANRAERRALEHELADANEDQEKILRARLEALDEEADAIRNLTEQYAELVQRQEDLKRRAEEVQSLGARLNAAGHDHEDSPQQLPGTGINSDASVVGNVVTDPNLTYDGKDFDHWKSVWRTELKTERRTEAIRALAAFGAHGYGREAAETILDVVKNYNLDNLHPGQPESQLVEAAVDAFVGGGVRIPFTESLPVLYERSVSGDPQIISFTRRVIGRLPFGDADIVPHVLKFAESDITGLRVSANHKLRGIYDHADEGLQKKIVEVFREAVKSEEKDVVATGLVGLYPIIREYSDVETSDDLRVGYVPELLQVLDHHDSEVRSLAIEVFKHLGGEAREAVPELRKMIEMSPLREAISALAALGNIGPAAVEAAPDILELLKQTESDGARENLIRILAEMKATPEVVFEHYLSGDPRQAVEHMRKRIPQLAAEYGEAAEPAARQVAPFLLSSDESIRRNALDALENMTGSHEYAERYLKRFVTRLPSSEQAERSLELLRIIETRKVRGEGERTPLPAEGEAYEDVLRARELDRRLSTAADDVPKLIESLRSSEPEQIKEALVSLQLLGPLGQDAAAAVKDVAQDGPEELRQLARGTLLKMKAAPEVVITSDLPARSPLVVQEVDAETGEIVTAEYTARAAIAQYGREAVPHLLPLLANEDEAAHRMALQGLADQQALDKARRHLERRLAEAPVDEDAAHTARMLRWVNALIEYYAQQPSPGEEAEDGEAPAEE